MINQITDDCDTCGDYTELVEALYEVRQFNDKYATKVMVCLACKDELSGTFRRHHSVPTMVYRLK